MDTSKSTTIMTEPSPSLDIQKISYNKMPGPRLNLKVQKAIKSEDVQLPGNFASFIKQTSFAKFSSKAANTLDTSCNSTMNGIARYSHTEPASPCNHDSRESSAERSFDSAQQASSGQSTPQGILKRNSKSRFSWHTKKQSLYRRQQSTKVKIVES